MIACLANEYDMTCLISDQPYREPTLDRSVPGKEGGGADALDSIDARTRHRQVTACQEGRRDHLVTDWDPVNAILRGEEESPPERLGEPQAADARNGSGNSLRRNQMWYSGAGSEGVCVSMKPDGPCCTVGPSTRSVDEAQVSSLP